MVAARRSIIAPNQDIEIRLHAKQKAFFDCDVIYKAFTAGIASGKSKVGAADAIAHSSKGDTIAVCGPSYRMLSDSTQRSFIETAEQFGVWDYDTFRKTDNQAILKNGVEVLFRSADDPDSNRGPSLSRVWLDEAGLMSEAMLDVMVGRLRQHGRQGRLTATFTPQGKEHWTYRIFADEENPRVKLFKCSTKDNPFVEPDFYENLKLQYGRGEGGILRAMQELEGEFVTIGGSEWGPECFGPSIWFDKWPDDPEAIKFCALDSSKGIGGKLGDYSTFAMMQASDGLLYVDFDMSNTRNTSALAHRAVEIQQTFQPDFFGIESEYGGQVMFDDLQQRADAANAEFNLMFIPTGGVQKDIRIRRLTRYLTNGMFRFKRSPGSKIGVTQLESWPSSLHDDSADALEMVVRLAQEAGLFAPQEMAA